MKSPLVTGVRVRPFPSLRLSEFSSVPQFYKRAPPPAVRTEVEPCVPFFVARRRGTNETDAPKQSKSTDRASKGRIIQGGGHGLRSEKASFPTSRAAKLLPFFPCDGFWRRSPPALFKMVNATRHNSGESVAYSTPVGTRLCTVGSVVLALGATAPKCLFTSQKLHLHLFHRGEGGRREGEPPNPPATLARPPPALQRPLSR